MDSVIIAIGDADTIRNIVKDTLYTESGDTFVINASYRESKHIMSSLAENGVNVYPHSQALKMMTTTQKFTPLKSYDQSTVYNWQQTGLEYFAVNSVGTFELFSIDKKDVKSVNKVEPIVDSVFSHNGAIIAFIRGNLISLHVIEALNCLIDIKTSEPIESAAFDETDKFLILRTKEELQIWDVFLGKKIQQFSAQDFTFSENGIFLLQDRIKVKFTESKDLPNKIEDLSIKEDKGFTITQENKTATFVDDGSQKIIFDDGKTKTVKSQMNIKSVQFFFAETRLFAFITKVVDSIEYYMIESYCNKEITIDKFEFMPISISVSDNSYVVLDSSKNVIFFVKEKYGFERAKTIKKDGDVVLSKMGDVTVIYDGYNGNIEFYDRNELRSVYSHPECSSFCWSHSKLYVAAYTKAPEAGGLLQIFNCDGRLMYKKTVSRLSKVEWRPFTKPSAEVRAEILKENPIVETSEELNDIISDTATLLSEWKAYLFSKLEKIRNASSK